MRSKAIDPVLGFIAAALSVVAVHQVIVMILHQLGLLPVQPWSMTPIGPWGVPTLVNQMFWGGLWGIVYALTQYRLPGREAWIKGVVFGLIVAVVGNFILVPLFKSQAPFMGGDLKKMTLVLLIHIGFGIGTALIYRLLKNLVKVSRLRSIR